MSSFPERGIMYRPEYFLRRSKFIDRSSMNRETKKVVDEGVAVATFLIGMSYLLYEHSVGMEMLWQGDDKAPDAKALIGENIYPIEVFCYTPYSLRAGESAVQLLERTKLSKTMDYPSDTILLCHIWPDLWMNRKSQVDKHIMHVAQKPYSLFCWYELPDNKNMIQSVNGWKSIDPGKIFMSHVGDILSDVA